MLIPRASRLLLTALVLVANLATPDLVCAEHGNHEGSGAPAAHQHDDAGEQAPRPAPPGDPCDDPALPSCCPALVSCSNSLAVGDSRVSLVDIGAAGIPSARSAGHLLSPNTSPDPPPPKG